MNFFSLYTWLGFVIWTWIGVSWKEGTSIEKLAVSIGLWSLMKDIFLINDGGEGFSLLWMVLTLGRWAWYKKGIWGSHRKSKPVSRVPDGLCFGLSIGSYLEFLSWWLGLLSQRNLILHPSCFFFFNHRNRKQTQTPCLWYIFQSNEKFANKTPL